MDGYNIYRFMELAIFALYLIFVFLTIQIWFSWKDIDKEQFKIKNFTSESFFRRNFMYVFSFSVFIVIHEILEGTSFPDAALYFEFFEMLALISLVLFVYEWYMVLKTCSDGKSLPQELSNNSGLPPYK